ncbi:AAA domain-containing protein [Streptomyces sp. DT2A-34]|uniref:AAA domain-containing protein n=1 Tax=unclassified Streptomyces TaxID=2593676 RepID=UPI00265BAB7C|nr:AAA domain-containing protein [Streptomyces sp. DT2A-34]MDO0917773.1 AAA family ATPase [Streptomyces sp. DT2A-34]
MTETSAADLSRQAVDHILTALTATSHRGVVVDSPPGAGKTTLVVDAAQNLIRPRHPCMIVAQTNAQVDDLATRLARRAPELTVARLSGQSYRLPARLHDWLHVLPNLTITTDAPRAASADVVVATASKWATVQGWHREWAIVDEAYQMRSDALLKIAHLSDRSLFVGDPGQLDPFSAIPTERWMGLPHDPMASAVAVLLKMNPDLPVLSLPVSWRLPASAAALISDAFYLTPFRAGTDAGTRRLTFAIAGVRGGAVDQTVELAARTGWALHELPACHTGRIDSQAAHAAISIAQRLLAREATAYCEDHPAGRPLEARDIAIGTAHRDQAGYLQQLLRADPRLDGIDVDTANRLQGREYAVTIVLHPLSGRRDTSSFHLEAGRLCVLTSRHRHACIVVARAGIDRLLDDHPTNEPVHLGVDAKFPDGWEAHQHVLHHLTGHRIRA